MQASIFKPVVEIPQPSTVIPADEKRPNTNYAWVMTDNERAHITQLLGESTSAIKIKGNVTTTDREVCKSCGKHSGLDDLVPGVLQLGIHSKAFMLDILQNGPSRPNPSHELHCSSCGNKFDIVPDWSDDGRI